MKYILILWLLVILSACSVNTSMPSWVVQSPTSPQYYYAVAQANQKLPNYREIARDMALKDIAMQISASVEASTNLKETESFGISNSEYRMQLQTSTSAKLQDLEAVETFSKGNIYYVCYRLDKVKYMQKRMQMLQNAKELCASLIKNSFSEQQWQPISIPVLIQAMDAIADYLDMDLSYPINGSNVNLYTAIVGRLRAYPTALDIIWDNAPEDMVAKHGSEYILSGKVLWEGIPVPNFALKFDYSTGKGKLDTQTLTNAKGEFVIHLKRIESAEANQAISASVDMEYYANMANHPATRKLWQSVRFTASRLNFIVRRPNIHIVINSNEAIPLLEKDIREYLAKLSIDANPAKKADYRLDINIDSRQGKAQDGIGYIPAFADIRISLQNPEGNKVFGRVEDLGMKSGAANLQSLKPNLHRDISKAINEGLLYRLLYSMLIR